DEQNALLLLPRDSFEVAIHLFLIFGRRPVVCACRESILRLLLLELLRQRRLDVLECLRRLTTEIFPASEILLERFGARSREGHPLPLEREAGAASGVRLPVRIVALQLIHQHLGLLQPARVLLAQPCELRAAAASAAGLPLAGASALARRLRRARRRLAA